MSWDKIGYSRYLIRPQALPKEVEPFDPVSFEYLIPEISGIKIVNYTSKNFNFIPTTPQANPKEGDTYYDEQDNKLKVYTGSAFETVTSS